MKKIAVLAAFALVMFAACDKYEDLPAPPVDAGFCQYNKSGLSQTYAQAELSRIVGIFQNSSIGSYTVKVKSSEVYVSDTKNGQPTYYGVQVVFSCDGAEIKFEEARGYYSSGEANSALTSRLGVLNAGRFIKVLDTAIHDYSTEDCDTCCDGDGNNCGDCNCTTDEDFAYSITYAKVNPNNNRQAGFIQAFEQMSQKVASYTGNANPSVADTLSAAKKVLPAFTTEGKVVRQWQQVVSAMGKMPRLSKKACPGTSRVVQQNSKHRYYR
jgi:hypothetical protein